MTCTYPVLCKTGVCNVFSVFYICLKGLTSFVLPPLFDSACLTWVQGRSHHFKSGGDGMSSVIPVFFFQLTLKDDKGGFCIFGKF